MRYHLKYSGTRFLSAEIKISQSPYGLSLNAFADITRKIIQKILGEKLITFSLLIGLLRLLHSILVSLKEN